ncbi:MAG TPA: methyltransferase domain-containing protein [bacterium]|nr:methyltransferase domain-containing protein [bacterium]
MHWSEAFFTDLYRRIGLDPKLQLGPEQAEKIKKALRLRKGSSVLDLCCGIGRHSVPLAKMGIRVTGFDMNAAYLSRARSLARREGVKVRFIRGDMRELDFKAEFDAVINMFTSFGYYDDETNLRILQRIGKALKPKGRLLLDTINRDFLVADFRKWRMEEIGGELLLNRHEFDPRTSRLKTRWRFIKGGSVEDMGGFDLRTYSLHELIAMIESAGMAVTGTYGGLGREPFKLDSNRIVIVAAKS